MNASPKNYVFLVLIFAVITNACEKINPSGSGPDELAATTNFSAYPLSGSIELTWKAVEGAESYNLYWTEDNSNPTESSNKITDLADVHYIHEGLVPQVEYKYCVQAVNGETTGPLSVVRSAIPQPPELSKPDGLSISVSGSSATLTWNSDNTGDIVYRVQRICQATDYSYSLIADNLNVMTYTDDGLSLGKGYFYKVSAYDRINNIESAYSDPEYAATIKAVFEKERNNENISNTLSYDTHFWDAEEQTEDLDWFTIQGGYTGTYAIYSAASYKNYEADCFLLGLDNGDKVTFTLLNGEMGGLWAMEITAVEYGNNTSGNDFEKYSHTFSTSSTSFVYNKTSTGTVFGSYLKIVMWDDLINTRPYNYKIEIKIDRQP